VTGLTFLVGGEINAEIEHACSRAWSPWGQGRGPEGGV